MTHCLRLAFLVCLASIFNPLYSQKNFEPGYVVKNQLDTLKGFIDYRNWAKNPEEIHFKKDIDGQDQIYTFSDISVFYVHGEHYVKAIVTLDVSPFKNDELLSSPVPQMQLDTVFLLTMFDGAKSLFYLKDKSDKVHFLIPKGSDYKDLTYHRYKIDRNGQSGIITIDKFKDQLTNYLNDCPTVLNKVSSLSYTQNAIGKLFEAYFAKCGATKPVLAQKLEKVIFQTGIVAGLSLSKLKFTGSNFPYLVGIDFPLAKQITGGAFLDIVFPRNQRRLSIYNELLFTSFSAKGHFEEYENDQNYSLSDVTLKYGYLKLNDMIRYKFPLPKFSFFVNAGISNGILVSETNYRRREAFLYSEKGDVTEGKAIGATRKYEQGALFGLGCIVKKFSVEIRSEFGNGMSPYNNFKSSVRRFNALLSYRF